jgi:hypothetical protein
MIIRLWMGMIILIISNAEGANHVYRQQEANAFIHNITSTETQRTQRIAELKRGGEHRIFFLLVFSVFSVVKFFYSASSIGGGIKWNHQRTQNQANCPD